MMNIKTPMAEFGVVRLHRRIRDDDSIGGAAVDIEQRVKVCGKRRNVRAGSLRAKIPDVCAEDDGATEETIL